IVDRVLLQECVYGIAAIVPRTGDIVACGELHGSALVLAQAIGEEIVTVFADAVEDVGHLCFVDGNDFVLRRIRPTAKRLGGPFGEPGDRDAMGFQIGAKRIGEERAWIGDGLARQLLALLNLAGDREDIAVLVAFDINGLALVRTRRRALVYDLVPRGRRRD